MRVDVIVVVPTVVTVIVDLTGPVVVVVTGPLGVVVGPEGGEVIPVPTPVPEDTGPMPLGVEVGGMSTVFPVPGAPGEVELDETNVGEAVALVVVWHPPLQLVIVTVEVVRVV